MTVTESLAKGTALLALAFGLAHSAHAQILIGQTVGVTGSAAITVAESTQGAALYIDHVNARGGVGGQKVEVVLMDDKFDPKLTLDNTRTLIEQKGVIGLFMTRGTPHTQGIVPVLEQHGVPLAGMPRSVLTQARRELARLEARAMEESRQPQLFACEPGEDLPPEPEPQCIEVLPAWLAPLADVDPRTLTLGQAIEWFERLRAALRAAENEAPRLTR